MGEEEKKDKEDTSYIYWWPKRGGIERKNYTQTNTMLNKRSLLTDQIMPGKNSNSCFCTSLFYKKLLSIYKISSISKLNVDITLKIVHERNLKAFRKRMFCTCKCRKMQTIFCNYRRWRLIFYSMKKMKRQKSVLNFQETAKRKQGSYGPVLPTIQDWQPLYG